MSVPRRIAEMREQLVTSPVGRHVLRMYREHRVVTR
jgi:hypothetical protein